MCLTQLTYCPPEKKYLCMSFQENPHNIYITYINRKVMKWRNQQNCSVDCFPTCKWQKPFNCKSDRVEF